MKPLLYIYVVCIELYELPKYGAIYTFIKWLAQVTWSVVGIGREEEREMLKSREKGK